MSMPEEYRARLSEIFGVPVENYRVEFTVACSSVAEARRELTRIRQMQKQLRLLKKEIGLTIREIHTVAGNQKAQIGKGWGSAILGGIFGQKSVGRANTVARAGLRRREQNIVQPLQLTQHFIDTMIIEIDATKLRIETWIEEHNL